LEEALNKR